MAIETSAAGAAALKFLGLPLIVGAAASALGFLVMWPRTLREAVIRLGCAVLVSFVAGPFLVVAVYSCWPTVFASSRDVAILYGLTPELGILFVAAPILLLAALPAWWVVGWVVRWMDSRRNKDLAEVVQDAKAMIREVRGTT